MATPAVISPKTIFPHNPYTHVSSTTPSLSGLISPPHSHPPDSRRTSDDTKDLNQSHRQSLPSIQEALGESKAPAYVAGPSITISPSHTYGTSYPQHPPTPTSRSFSGNTVSYQPSVDQIKPRRPSPPLQPPSYPRAEHAAQPSYDHPRQQSLPSIHSTLQPSAHGSRHDFTRHEHDSRIQNGYTYQTTQYNGHVSAPGSISSTYSPRSPYQPNHYVPRYGPEHGPKQHLKLEHEDQSTGYGPVLKRNLDYWDVEVDLRTVSFPFPLEYCFRLTRNR